jgi:pyridoxine 5-phosphate synthase
MNNKIRLGLNIDHVATIRNARGGSFPDPIEVAKMAKKFGVDGITAHLREDRRHIKDNDVFRLKKEVDLPLNFEMAYTDEMVDIALKLKPNAACIVPENRQELTTEGGLDVIGNEEELRTIIKILKKENIRISLFVDSNLKQIAKTKEIGADIIEVHTGKYCDSEKQQDKLMEYQKIAEAINFGHNIGLECHAGHGLNYQTAKQIAQIPNISEFNIGHFIVSDSILIGLEEAIKKMKKQLR